MATKDSKPTVTESAIATETTSGDTEAVTLKSFVEKFGKGGPTKAYLRARAEKVNTLKEVEPFLDEFANTKHKRTEMRKWLMQLGGIEEPKEGEGNGD